MKLEPRTFRRVMRSLAAGVTVVTVRDPQGRPWGLTATAVCLVSWEPPTAARVYRAYRPTATGRLRRPEAFAVNVLRDDQEDLSRHFANKDAHKFAAVPWRDGDTGAPILDGVLAHVECRTTPVSRRGITPFFSGEAVGGALTAAGRRARRCSISEASTPAWPARVTPS